MSGESIYLYKSARRPRYRKENLNLVAAQRGTVVEVAYNRSWISHRYYDAGSIPRGSEVYFLLTDRPYSRFVPVRKGEVVAAEYDDLMLRLQVALNTWVGVEDMDVETFTRRVKESADGDAPERKFIGPKLDGVDLVRYYDGNEARGWRQAIEQTLEMSRGSEDQPYERSVFFRPAGFQPEGGEALIASRQPVEPGTRGALHLEFHNPHLADRETGDFRLRAIAPEDQLRVGGPETFPLRGRLSLDVEVLDDAAELLLQIGPVPGEHTSVVERFFTRAPETRLGRSAGERLQRIEPEELLRLYESIKRAAEFANVSDWIDVISDFERLLPGEQRVREDHALALLDDGREEDAYRILKELNREMLHDRARLELFRMLLDRAPTETAANEVDALNLTAEGRVGEFLNLLETRSADLLGKLLPELLIVVPADPELLRRLMGGVGGRIDSAEAAAKTAGNLYEVTGDARWAYGYLEDRVRECRLSSASVADTLVLLAEKGGRPQGDSATADAVETHISHLIERNELDEAQQLLARAKHAVGRSARNRLFHLVADRLARHECWEEGALTMVQLAQAAMRTGDLEVATSAVERAYGLWNSSDETATPPDWLRDVDQRAQAAWENIEPLVEWRKSAEERRREALQGRFRHQTVLIAGGFRQPDWMEKLEDLTAASVEWAEKYRDEGDDLSRYADRIRNGRYAAVVHFWQKTGHQTGDQIKPACVEAGVPMVHATSAGYQGLVAALCDLLEA